MGETPDDELIARATAGETAAYAELWSRHYAAGIRAAHAITTSIEAEDLVQEAFTRIYRSVRSGRGPKQAFRSYLYATIRNTAATWGNRKSREITSETIEDLEESRPYDAASDDRVDASFALAAFQALPERWQEVLWYLEIEDLKPAAAAKLLGISAHATSQLAVRAKAGLRDAWISAHVSRTDPDTECNWVAARLGGYMREASSARELARIEQHLAGCASCRKAAHEAREVASRLRSVVLPLVLGASGATAFISSMQGGATAASAASSIAPVSAAAPPVMPHAVVASSITSRLAAVAAWKWAATLAVIGAGIIGAILLSHGSAEEPVAAAPKPTAAATPTPEPTAPPQPTATPEPTPQAPAPPEEPDAPVEVPEPTDPPAPPTEPKPETETRTDPEPIPAPAVWNTSRTAQADGGYAITVMLGGKDGASAVALLDGIEIARADGAAPQLSFSLTADQYASGSLSFALSVDHRLGVKTETRTPADWCESGV